MAKPAGMTSTEFHRVRHLAAIKAWDKRGRKNKVGVEARRGAAEGDWRFSHDPGAGPHIREGVVGGVIRPGGPVQARGDWKASKWADKESRMSTTPPKEIKSLAEKTDRGVSESYEMRLEDGTHGNFKPASGELERCRDGIEKGQMPERELGAWEVAKIVGMDDMVAPVVIREFDVPGGGEDPNGVPYLPGKKRGSFAEWQEGELGRHIGPPDMWDGKDDAIRAALYDYVIGNMDRHSKNWVIAADGKMKLIDHGLAFGENERMDGGGNYQLMAHAIRDLGGRPPRAEIEKYVKNKSAILEALKRTGLPAKAIRRVGERIDRMASADSFNVFNAAIAPMDPIAMLLGMLRH